MLLQLKAPHFTAGLVLANGKVVRAAPICSYMLGWSEARVREYCFRKFWKVLTVSES
jgi:hypothetical protein